VMIGVCIFLERARWCLVAVHESLELFRLLLVERSAGQEKVQSWLGRTQVAAGPGEARNSEEESEMCIDCKFGTRDFIQTTE
jgi:hypothetical protein